jgi:hypothetical protein
MRNKQQYTVLNAQAATGPGIKVFVNDFKTILVSIAATGMGAGDTIVVKAQGSMEETAPTFSTAKSSTNKWDYVQMVDLQNGSTIDGDTGVTFSDADDVQQFEVNTNGLVWFTLNVTTISDAVNTSVTAVATLQTAE